MKCALLVAATAFVGSATAQRLVLNELNPQQIKSISVLKNTGTVPFMNGADFGSAEAIDTTRIVVIYTLRYTANGEAKSDDYALQVAPRHTRFYAVANERADSLQSAGQRGAGAMVPADEVYTDLGQRRLTVINRLPAIEGKPLLSTYDEASPATEWRMTGAADSLAGYLCHEATADFRGRTWHVWYAPELPFGAGPWKLAGTPGLILQAEDAEGCYRFELKGLLQREEPVLRYKRPMKKGTRKKVADYVEQFYAEPYRFLGDGDSHIFVTQDTQGKITCLDETNWKLEYDPLERE